MLADAVVLGRALVGRGQDRLDALPTSRMTPRGSTRLTVPVMISPSRLRELVEDLVALDLAQALADELLGDLGADAAEDVAVELLGLDQVADLGVGLVLARRRRP